MELQKISPAFEYSSKGFAISKVLLSDITSKLDRPFYVYDCKTIETQYAKLRKNLPSVVEIFYAVKANSHKAVMKILQNLGTGFEVASHGELLACESINADTNRIVFAGPGKTDEDLEKAILMNIASINVENFLEGSDLVRISKLAGKLGKVANVCLRINPYFKIKGATLAMGGEATQFGIEESKLEQAILMAKTLPNINLRGIHIFAGTNINDALGFIANLENSFKLAEKMNSLIPVTLIDVGGGIGVPYRDGDSDLSLEGIGKQIEEIIKKYSFIEENKTRIILEPGRYLVAQSGIYVAKIIDLKDSKGKKYIILEGGINHMLRPALIASSEHQAFNLTRDSKEKINFDVAGPLCTPVDILTREASLPIDTAIGDYVGIFCAGAYGFNESMPLFLSHDFPAEVLVYNNKFEIIRESLKIEEILKTQKVPIDL